MKRLKMRECSVLHYGTAFLFLLTPVLSGVAAAGPQAWVPLAMAVMLASATFAARDRIGPGQVIGPSMRQSMELVAATVLSLSPWLFGFADLTWRPHLLVGQVGIGVSILTQTVEELPAGALSALRRTPGPHAPAQGTPTSQKRAARALSPSRSSGP